MKKSRTIRSAVVASACLLVSCGDGSPTHPDPAGTLVATAPAEGLAVSASNRPPEMNLRTTPAAVPGTPHPVVAGPAPLTVQFNLCQSSDPDQNPTDPASGDSLNWQFHFGEGGEAFNPDGTFNPDAEHRCRVEYSYARQGRYLATVSVTDKHLEDQSRDVVALARVTQRLTIEAGPEGPGADAPAPPPCGGDGACTVFVTSSTHDGVLAGLAGADSICQGLAEAAGRSGRFQAWLSDDAQGPATRFATRAQVAYVLTDGSQLAADWSDLTDGSIGALISSDETGAFVPYGSLVWTNTQVDGTPGTSTGLGVVMSQSCANWSSRSMLLDGGFSITGVLDRRWTFADSRFSTIVSCDFTAVRLYCFEQ